MMMHKVRLRRGYARNGEEMKQLQKNKRENKDT